MKHILPARRLQLKLNICLQLLKNNKYLKRDPELQEQRS